MRIISGTLKGKSLNFIKNLNTRPLKDIVKENIFNILQHSNFIKTDFKSSNILDLYSGVGSFGIECISRGSNNVVFVEKDNRAANILRENLNKLSINNKATIFVDYIENVLIKKFEKKFNIIFLDPPFNDNNFIKIIKLIKERNIFKKKNIIIIHRERKSEDMIEGCLSILKIKEYGRSKIIIGSIN